MTELGLNLTLKSNPNNISSVETFVTNVFAEFQIDESYFGNVLIALTEAVSNAIIHGNKSQEEKKVYVTSLSDSSKVVITVEDEGRGFDPHNLPDPTAPENLLTPGGRGVFLMHQLADKIEYFENGRIIKMIFHC